jgi:hypothetical protein
MVWSQDLADALNCEAQSCGNDSQGDCHRGEWFGFAVSVGVFVVGWFCGDSKAEPEENGAENIEAGLDAIGNEGVTISPDAGSNFG